MAYYVSTAGPTGTIPGVQVVINEDRCRSCANCYKLCPASVLGAQSPLYKAEVTNIDGCTGCRLCELLCTDFAINIIVPDRVAAA